MKIICKIDLLVLFVMIAARAVRYSSALRFPTHRPFHACSALFSKDYITVPFELKDEAKSLGARWDADAKKWFVPSGVDPKLFEKFSNVYLEVPFSEKEEVKSLGGRWDKDKMKWYVTVGKDISPFSKWLTGSSKTPETSETSETPETPETPAKGVKSSPKYSSKQSTNSKFATKTNTVVEDASQCIVLLGIDTNGLPLQEKGQYLPYDHLNAYDSSRLIQVSFQLCRLRDLQPLSSGTYTIQSDGFPIDNSEYHNITLAVSKSTGVPFTVAAEKLFDALKNANYVVAHNSDYVYNVLSSELFRHGLLDMLTIFDGCKKYCSMMLTQGVLGLKDKRGEPKKPSLKELVQATTGEELPSVRNSTANVEYLRKAMQILVNTNRLALGK